MCLIFKNFMNWGTKIISWWWNKVFSIIWLNRPKRKKQKKKLCWTNLRRYNSEYDCNCNCQIQMTMTMNIRWFKFKLVCFVVSLQSIVSIENSRQVQFAIQPKVFVDAALKQAVRYTLCKLGDMDPIMIMPLKGFFSSRCVKACLDLTDLQPLIGKATKN